MAQIKSRRDLLVWQKGMDLVTAIYALTKQFPVEERYGLIQQATRAQSGLRPTSQKGIRAVRAATTRITYRSRAVL